MSQDTSATAQSASLASSTAGSTPLRAQLSLLRQRIILTLRWLLRPLYRLPIDDIKDQQIQNQIEFLNDLNKKALETITTMSRALSQVDARVRFYETHIPRMRELRRKFEQEQQKLRDMANGDAKAEATRLEHGIVGEIRQ